MWHPIPDSVTSAPCPLHPDKDLQFHDATDIFSISVCSLQPLTFFSLGHISLILISIIPEYVYVLAVVQNCWIEMLTAISHILCFLSQEFGNVLVGPFLALGLSRGCTHMLAGAAAIQWPDLTGAERFISKVSHSPGCNVNGMEDKWVLASWLLILILPECAHDRRADFPRTGHAKHTTK